MSQRDWGGTVLVACLVALAGLLHNHTVPLVLLSVAAIASAVVIVRDAKGRTQPAKRRGQSGIRAGTTINAGQSIETDGPIDAGESIDAGGNIRAGVPAWLPPPLPPERPGAPLLTAMDRQEQRAERDYAIRRGSELVRLILQLELQCEATASDKEMGVAFINLAFAVEAWARGTGSTEEVPQFSGDTGADLARLKRLVKMELARLRAQQEQ